MGRMLDGRAPHRDELHRLIAVSNSAEGARTVAQALTAAIDGAPFFVVLTSTPLSDRDDPSRTRWSSTLEIRHHT